MVPWLPYSGNTRTTGRPDLDSLNLGNGGHAWGQGLSDMEKLVYASFWAIVGAPTYTGVDLEKLDPHETDVLVSPLLRAINAHPITASLVPSRGEMKGQDEEVQTWLTDYQNGTLILGLFNLADSNRTTSWTHRNPFSAFDIWANKPFECAECAKHGHTGVLMMSPHSTLLLRVTDSK